MERRRKVRQRLSVVPACRSKPGPALIRRSNLDLLPETLDLPIPVDAELTDINRAPAVFDLLHAIQTLSHETKVSFVTGLSFAVPGAFEMVRHLIRQVVGAGCFWIILANFYAIFNRFLPQLF